MATSETREWTPESTVEIPRPTESDRQRATTDNAGWGQPESSSNATPDVPIEAADPADDLTGSTTAQPAELEVNRLGSPARQPIAEGARIDRAALRDAMIDDEDTEQVDDRPAEVEDSPSPARVAEAREAVRDAYAPESESYGKLARQAIGDFESGATSTSDIMEQSARNAELPPPIGDRDAELAEHDFAEDDITPIGGGHANGAYEIDTIAGEREVYKPASDEVPLRNDIEAGDYWKHEVAAYQVDQMLGFDLVPPTAAVDGPSGVGSLQEWAPAAGQNVDDYSLQDQQMMGVLDYILGSSDRHPENYLTQANGRPAAIDNGLSLPVADRDGMYSEFADSILHKPLDQSIIEKVNIVDDATFAGTLQRCGIDDLAIDRALTRLHECQSGHIDGVAWDGLIFGRDFEQLT